jgi:hypothetical protein
MGPAIVQGSRLRAMPRGGRGCRFELLQGVFSRRHDAIGRALAGMTRRVHASPRCQQLRPYDDFI